MGNFSQDDVLRLRNILTMKQHMDYRRPSLNTFELTARILEHHGETLDSLQSVLHHPRSLARPTPDWRPPQKQLPDIAGDGVLTMTLTRHRVGPRARARVRGFGETREPAYLVSVRITNPNGYPVLPALAEAWVRALVPGAKSGAVHEITTGSAATFLWLVDKAFLPVRSPVSLFEGLASAA